MTWSPDEVEHVEAQWFNGNQELTTGTATAKLWYWSGGNRQYLQDNGSVSTTENALDMTHDGDAWEVNFTVPSEFGGELVIVEVKHSDRTDPNVSWIEVESVARPTARHGDL